LKGSDASNSIERTFEHHVGMETETVGVVPPNPIDIRLNYPMRSQEKWLCTTEGLWTEGVVDYFLVANRKPSPTECSVQAPCLGR